MRKIYIIITCLSIIFLNSCSINSENQSNLSKQQKFQKRNDFSCIIQNNGITKTYYTTGIYDLYHILCTDKAFLDGAYVRDRAIGKAAAALIIIGGAKKASTPLISTSAKNLLIKHGVEISYDKEVDNILNRNKTDLCPMEKRITHTNSLYEIYIEIEKFVNE